MSRAERLKTLSARNLECGKGEGMARYRFALFQQL